MQFLCGIDEAGRGPLAGPLLVAGVILEKDILGLNDSKVLSEKKREKLFDEIIENSKYHIVFKSAKEIDEFGISFCLKSSILEIMEQLQEFSSNFLMDGNTNFGMSALRVRLHRGRRWRAFPRHRRQRDLRGQDEGAPASGGVRHPRPPDGQRDPRPATADLHARAVGRRSRRTGYVRRRWTNC